MGKDLFKEGEPVWVKHDAEAWARGRISARSGSKVTVKLSKGGSVTVSVNDCEYCSTTPQMEAKVEDMTKLPDLHHPALLATLNERFNKDKIYTYTGPILIAVNPFKSLTKLYEPKRMLEYLNAEIGVRDQLPPHAWNLAHNAYSAMIRTGGRNQSVLVSGESGAGKTVSTKIVMNYLTVVSSGNFQEAIKKSARRASVKDRQEAGVSQRVLEANPLMEAFGNAKTLRNDNSSRFGKLIQLQFHEQNYHLIGAAVDVYLLEKSRVVRQADGERNYHIFYEMDAGLSSGDKKRLMFPNIEDCYYTNQSSTFDRADIGDKEQFKATQTAFDVVGFTAEEKEAAFRMISALLHLGNIDFEEHSEKGEEGSRVTSSAKTALASCAELLCVKKDLLEKTLTSRVISIGGGGLSSALSMVQNEPLVKRYTPKQSRYARDGLAQAVYERLFLWIVWRINQSITTKAVKKRKNRMSTGRLGAKGKSKSQEYYNDYSIGCLDIFGFEVFEKNTFEQLLINYTNEQLQNQFNEFVFRLEQKEYEQEGIDWTVIDFPDNSRCLEMVENRPIGLLSLIDEECLYPNGSDKSLATKLTQNLAEKYKGIYIVGRNETVRNQFVINHFAGEVVYDVKSFCRKNRNELRQEAIDLLHTSKIDLFAVLLPPDAATTGGGGDAMEYFSKVGTKKRNSVRSSLERHQRSGAKATKLQSKTVSSQFKAQLSIAMRHIRSSEPHYVRCLKSNDENVSEYFDRVRIDEQLRYSGVLETVKVARAGYSTRFEFKEFANRFAALAHKSVKGAARKTEKMLKNASKGTLRSTCEKIVINGGLEEFTDYQIGHTKVFLKPHAYSNLEIQKADAYRKYIILLQRNIRIWLRTYRASRKVRAAKRIQRLFRGYLIRRKLTNFRQRRKAAVQIQRMARGMITRQRIIPVLKSRGRAASKIKKAYRRKVMKDRLREIREESVRQRAAIMLQGVARVIKAQKIANNLYAEETAKAAALQLEKLARKVAEKKTREMVEQEREAAEIELEQEYSGERGAMMLYLGPLLVVFAMMNPMMVVGLSLFLIAMVLGGGLMLEAQQRQASLEMSSRSYAKRARRNRRTAETESVMSRDSLSLADDDASYYYYTPTSKEAKARSRARSSRKVSAKSVKSERSSKSGRSSRTSAVKRRDSSDEVYKNARKSATRLTNVLKSRARGTATLPVPLGSSHHPDAFDDLEKFGVGSKMSKHGRLRSTGVKKIMSRKFGRKSAKSRSSSSGSTSRFSSKSNPWSIYE